MDLQREYKEKEKTVQNWNIDNFRDITNKMILFLIIIQTINNNKKEIKKLFPNRSNTYLFIIFNDILFRLFDFIKQKKKM